MNRLNPRRLAPVLALAAAATCAAPAAPADEPTLSYRLRPGDTLIGLGQRLLLNPADWPQLQRLNAVRRPRAMPVGMALRIPLRLLRGEPAAAAVVSVHGDVGGATAGQALTEGSDIRTGADGQAVVRLVDGSVLHLRAGSRLSIVESRRLAPNSGLNGGPDEGARSGVRLEQGRVEIKAQTARGGVPGFRIHTPQGVLGVRGTEFRVSSHEGVTRGEVLHGVVAVTGAAGAGTTSAADEVRLAADQGTLIDAQGHVAAARALPPPPSLEGLPALHERPLVRLQIPMSPASSAVQGWRVQIARDARFDELLVDQYSATPDVRIAGLDDGRYPMRLRAVGADGLEGPDAVTTLVLKARPEPPLPRAPGVGAVIVGNRAELAWTAGGEARRYRLQLGRADAAPGATPFAPPLVDRGDLSAPELALDELPPGRYLWRLASVRADGDQGPFGDAQAFELRALPGAPQLPAPPAVGDGGLQLYWQGQPGQRFDVQLARDPGFTEVVAERATDAAQLDLPLPGSGRFYVRLRARDADGYIGPWSAAQHFDVVACVRDGGQTCWRVGDGRLNVQ
jgi:hypothetical protein